MDEKEMMEMIEKRNKLIQKAKDLKSLAKKEKRKLTEEEGKTFDEALSEAEELLVEIRRSQKLNENVDSLDESTGVSTIETEKRSTNIVVGKDLLEEKEFRNLGEFVATALKNPRSPQLRTLQMNIGETGGFMIPAKFAKEIRQFSPEQAIVRPRAVELPGGGENPDSTIYIPALKQSTNVYGGVIVKHTGEAQEMTETEAELENLSLTPHEVTAYTKLSNKLLNNAPAMSSFMKRQFREAVAGAEDKDFISGSGTARAEGFLNAPGAVKIKRNTTGTIKIQDLRAMKKALPEGSKDKAVWVIAKSAEDTIAGIVDETGKKLAYNEDTGKLLGIPVIFSGKMKELGVEGDIALCDFAYYLIKDGSPLMLATSEHAFFTSNITAIKVVWNFDGKLWNREVLTLEDKTKVSGVVILKK